MNPTMRCFRASFSRNKEGRTAVDYESRLAEMEAWYGTLIGGGGGAAERALLEDYAPMPII